MDKDAWESFVQKLNQFAIVGGIIAALVGGGVLGGRVLSSVESLNVRFARFEARMEVLPQLQWEMNNLRDRVQTLERQANQRN